ncbi:uncharacterized protein LOC130361152 isoform X2 [Hyla sarda]|uniref:uncharacterized protein LOC130361152 isoform X2 n=1 Tax=Hyla sarda TaxID=327740 RepID=UPI0024C29DE6|nr:uncharacterized protein LOC130361152 isoform X2 [Hyla sarda]
MPGHSHPNSVQSSKRSKQVDLLKNKSRTKRPNSELKKVITLKEIETRETNGIKNGTIVTGTEVNSKENNKTTSLKTSAVRGSVMSESGNTSVDLLRRVLPPPPENLQAPPPAEALDDPLYDSVKEMRAAPSNDHDVTMAPGSSSLERRNPLYVSADEMKDPPSYQEAILEYPSAEANKKDRDSKTQVVDESLYAVIHKQPSVKTPPPQNSEQSASHKVILVEEIKIDSQTVSFINKEKTPRSQSPSEKLDSMLNNCKKRSFISAQPPRDKTVNITQNAPPLVPAKRFDIEGEFEQYTIEEETEMDKESPLTT